MKTKVQQNGHCDPDELLRQRSKYGEILCTWAVQEQGSNFSGWRSSVPGPSMWDLWWTKQHLDRLVSEQRQCDSTSTTTVWFHQYYHSVIPPVLPQCDSTSTTTMWFHQCYHNVIPPVLPQCDSTSTTTMWFHQYYHNVIPPALPQ